jgi:hypothetical protein
MEGARNCYQSVLKRGANKTTLQSMSMLCRTFAKSKAAPGSLEQRDYVNESMEHAKAAVKLDMSDGHSWFNVGMAYMTQFFAEGASDPTKLAAAGPPTGIISGSSFSRMSVKPLAVRHSPSRLRSYYTIIRVLGTGKTIRGVSSPR